MICPYCKNELYQSDKNLLLKDGKLVDIYECEWENQRFIVKAGKAICSDAFGNIFHLDTGQIYPQGMHAIIEKTTNAYGDPMWLIGIADKDNIVIIKNYYRVPQFTEANALHMQKCIDYDIAMNRVYFTPEEVMTMAKGENAPCNQ